MSDAADDTNEPELVEVTSVSDLGLLTVIEGLLEAEGIPFVAQGEYFTIGRGVPNWPVPVKVPSDRAEEARALIAKTLG